MLLIYVSNRRLAAGKLAIDFKKPWNYLYFLPAEARAPSEARGEGERNRLWWTCGESNPDLLHAMEMFCHYTTGPLSPAYLQKIVPRGKS
jgi:hypothetical protein